MDNTLNRITNIFNKLLDKFSLGLNSIGDKKSTFTDVLMIGALILGMLKLFKVKVKVG